MNGYMKLGLEWNLSAVKFEAIVCLGIFCSLLSKLWSKSQFVKKINQTDLFLLYMHNICNIFSLHLRQIFDRYTKLFLALEDKFCSSDVIKGLWFDFLGTCYESKLLKYISVTYIVHSSLGVQ